MLTFLIEMDGDNYNKYLELYKLYYNPLLAYAVSIVKSKPAAEDAVHEVYLRISRNLDNLEEPASKRTKQYLVSAVHNVCIDHLRKPDADDIDTLEVSDDRLDPALQYTEMTEIISDLAVIIKSLKAKDQVILVYRFDRGYSSREVAELLGVSEVYVNKRVQQLRSKLKKELRSKRGDIHEVMG